MTPSRDISRLIEIMAALRTPVTGCPWEVQYTFWSPKKKAARRRLGLPRVLGSNPQLSRSLRRRSDFIFRFPFRIIGLEFAHSFYAIGITALRHTS